MVHRRTLTRERNEGRNVTDTPVFSVCKTQPIVSSLLSLGGKILCRLFYTTFHIGRDHKPSGSASTFIAITKDVHFPRSHKTITFPYRENSRACYIRKCWSSFLFHFPLLSYFYIVRSLGYWRRCNGLQKRLNKRCTGHK